MDKEGKENSKTADELVVIVMGSSADKEYAREITRHLEKFQMPYVLRVASAHKTPEHLLGIIREYDSSGKKIVYLAVAGRSNALGGAIAGSTVSPVISAPVYSEKYGGLDIFSSLRMPSGVPAPTAIETEMAAHHALRIFALNNPRLADELLAYQKEKQQEILAADAGL